MKCLRLSADVQQIRACQHRVSDVEDRIKSLSDVLSLAGNQVRLKILFLLNGEGQLCVCDLSDILEMNVSAVSQHLRKMKDGGLIHARKSGQIMNYALSGAYSGLLSPFFNSISAQAEPHMS